MGNEAPADSIPQLIPFPVKEHDLVLYLQHMAEATKSKAAVEEAVYSMTWAHNLASVPSPAGSSLVTTTYIRRPKKSLGQAGEQEGAHHCGHAQSNSGGHEQEHNIIKCSIDCGMAELVRK